MPIRSIRYLKIIVAVCILLASQTVWATNLPEVNVEFNQLKQEVYTEASFYEEGIKEILKDSLEDFEEFFADHQNGETELDEFTDLTTSLAQEITEDLEDDFQEHALGALTSIQEDVEELARDYPKHTALQTFSARQLFLKHSRHKLEKHRQRIDHLISLLEQSQSTVDPEATIAIEIFTTARKKLIKYTIDL